MTVISVSNLEIGSLVLYTQHTVISVASNGFVKSTLPCEETKRDYWSSLRRQKD